MAHAESFSALATDDLSCPVCFELLRDPNTPKLLDCPHVCCAVCIRKMVEDGKENVECPECRHLTRIPDGGVSAMRTILRVQSLAEKHEETRIMALQNIFCDKETTGDNAVGKKMEPSTCEEHNEPLNYFCKSCYIAGCTTCMVKNHKGSNHVNVTVESVHREKMGEIDALLACATAEISEQQKWVEELQTIQSSIKESIDSKKRIIEGRAEEVTRKISDEGELLISCLRKRAEPRLDRVMQEKELLQMEMQEAMETIVNIKHTLDTTESHELVKMHADHVQTIKSLLDKEVKAHTFGPISPIPKFEFKEPLDASGLLPTIFPARNLHCHLERVFGYLNLKAAVSIAEIPGGFLISDFEKRKVYIYENNDFERYSKLYLSKVPSHASSEPYGVAVTRPEGRYLVARKTTIDVYSQYQRPPVYEGELDLRHAGENVDVFRDIQTIVTMHDGQIVAGECGNSALIIISRAHGQVPIPPRVIQINTNPMCMCVMPNGYIAVSNCRKDRNGRICVVDVESGGETLTINIPYVTAVCYHEQSDSLLVSRVETPEREYDDDGGFGGERARLVTLEQYCAATGRLIGRIGEGFENPQDMIVTCGGNKLVVADCKSVKQYKLIY